MTAKDELVSLADAVGALAGGNPEEGSFGRSLCTFLEALVDGIEQRLALAITPPNVDGGLLKLKTSGGLFSERDLTRILYDLVLSRTRSLRCLRARSTTSTLDQPRAAAAW